MNEAFLIWQKIHPGGYHFVIFFPFRVATDISSILFRSIMRILGVDEGSVTIIYSFRVELLLLLLLILPDSEA